KASWTCKDADHVASDVRKALRLAVSGRAGAVHLSLPTDCLEDTAGPSPTDDVPRVQSLRAEDAQSLRERLARAKRPLILGGPASLTRRGRERMRALEEALGIPAIGMESPRGI